jgi:hypothetical protein
MATFNNGDTYLSIRNLLNDTGLRKNTYTENVPPGASDDESAGYEVGSEWLDNVTNTLYYCTDAVAGGAVWNAVGGFGDADVDAHLNTSTATSGEVLSWTGSDYDWVAQLTNPSGLATGTATDGTVWPYTENNKIFITANPTSTDTAIIGMGESAAINWGTGSYVLHGTGLGQSVIVGNSLTGKIFCNGPHLGIAAWNDVYLGTRYAALYTDNTYDITLSSHPSGHVALAIDNNDKLVVDGPTDTISTLSANVDFSSSSVSANTITANSIIVNGTLEADQVITSGTGPLTFDSASTITLDAPDGVIINTGPLRLPNLTTTERNGLAAANGDMIYNITDSKLQGYQAGAWINLDGT